MCGFSKVAQAASPLTSGKPSRVAEMFAVVRKIIVATTSRSRSQHRMETLLTHG